MTYTAKEVRAEAKNIRDYSRMTPGAGEEWDRNADMLDAYAALLEQREAGVTDAQMRELISAAIDYFGPMDDPSIGWLGRNPSGPEIFRCEKCGAEHRDCSEISHIKGCRATRLRDVLIDINEVNS